ncbi:MAG: RpiB/LacA/LacB family sugar-phosphate isomerase [Thermoguttaceae bacterium]|nr:RpiB/LacA/LacB family sugar-phosphate isomerase [Thermoguttaceae bacterium]
MRIMIGSDHHGIDTRLNLGRIVASLGHEVRDFGPTPDKPDPVDYPDVAAPIAQAVSTGEMDRGILICGTGIGMSIVANKFPGVRAAPVVDVFSAELSRRHNNLNVLCLSGDMLTEATINDVVKTWLKTDFSKEERHARRLRRISEIEEEQIKKNKKRLDK